jgi:uncharacterized protein YecE (DUF72 family)
MAPDDNPLLIVRIGTAGWSIPRASATRFDSAGTHLERYARVFNCAEINSSFHRPHAAATYAKWRESTPPAFRFAVKVPRTITHERKLQDAREPFTAFLAQTDGLAGKRGPLLLQLPPSLSFNHAVVPDFLSMVREVYGGPIAALAMTVAGIASAEQIWCMFDNTASGAAIENAWELRERMSSSPALTLRQNEPVRN